jgi:Bacterial PH domain
VRIEPFLDADEKVTARARLHVAVFTGAATLAAVSLAVAGLIVARNPLRPESVRLVWLVAAVVAASGFVSPVMRWLATEVAVTDRRVLAVTREGLGRPRALELPFQDMAEVEVERTVAGRLLGYGTLRLVARGGATEEFARVADAEAVRAAAGRGVAPSGRRRARR